MEIGHLIPHIEALIFASDKPLTALELTDLINNAFGFMEDKIVLDQVEAAIEGVVEKYRSEFYPFEVKESGGGWQFLTKRDFHKTVAQLNGEKFLKRLSSAALEALSIIAYKQPVTKAEIEAIRGVSSDYAIQKLLEKELIVITGRNEALPGHPLVYATSKNFMDYFGINSPEDLPKLKEIFDENLVDATRVDDAVAQQTAGDAAATEEDANLAVGENGELIEGSTGPHLNGEKIDFETGEVLEEGTEQSATDDLSEEEAGEEEATDDENAADELAGDEELADEEAGEDEGEEADYDPASEDEEEEAAAEEEDEESEEEETEEDVEAEDDEEDNDDEDEAEDAGDDEEEEADDEAGDEELADEEAGEEESDDDDQDDEGDQDEEEDKNKSDRS
ncbi:SMC-Scp complex subunit ScpB [Paraflavitalea pollutisoli]|uniref:SMC-Scp complex subunit ScpB n=1 Tax=Paraflavitalea pollutisoli TaxID=3034143 RepID=UPI0023EB5D48|nr:SMC-Scp complex subunit ScpB [Paraflavitalea sp. H1-2-19X]